MGGGLLTRRTRLTRTTLRNFGGARSLDLDLGRITALIGPTGSGKSTVLRALLVLRAALAGESGAGGAAAYDGGLRDMAAGGGEARRIRIGVSGQKVTGMDGSPDVASRFSYGAEFGGSVRPDKVDATVEMWRGQDAAGPCEARLVH